MGYDGITIHVDPARMRPWEIWHLQSNNDKLYGTISYRPQMLLEEALCRTINYFRSTVTSGTGEMEAFEELEERLSAWSGCQNVVACSSGTAALHLAFEALQLPIGSQVIMPEFTMVACARAATMAGLRPVFVDCGEDLLMDVEKIEDYVSDLTSAILMVHVYGRVCDMERIRWIAARHNLSIIEDLAEAHGVRPDYHTRAACWSFYRNR